MRPSNREMEERIHRAIVRISRERYLPCIEMMATIRKLVDCGQRKCYGRIIFRRCMPPGVEGLGIFQGEPPYYPYVDKNGYILMERLKRICPSKKRGARAELEILKFKLKVGAYK